ncbi:MAG: hypothetical protein M1302_05620 [Candidatus Thermoplasmatota archaeon]|nr:hypothetical protein [Candidatus Thermoplasmatota archaeon]
MDHDGSGSSKIAVLLTLMTALLGIQFVAGMYANSFYGSESGSILTVLVQFARYPVLAFHILLGAFTFIVSFYAFILGITAKLRHDLLILLGLNSICILTAGISGLLYLSTKSALYTFSMAMLWLLAFGFIGFSQTMLRSSMSKAKS